ncbi:MAG: phosphotransferase [Opitutaceae bacterium]|nr:phosphotransferase [Opitutaceae bacterium]
MSASSDSLIAHLRAAGTVTAGPVRVRGLEGGVSSEIALVEDGDRRLVVKRALPRLKVSAEWLADTGRNRTEWDYFDYAARVVPESVPRILAGNREEGWFAMEYFGDGFRTWKQMLLAGHADRGPAVHAGAVLGRLHAASWGDSNAAARFATLSNFHALRIEPYLLTTAARVPAVRDVLEAEAGRLARTNLALVHGDYSPKNLLVSHDRIVVLDAECGWYGDPAFDTAFLLCHLHLKTLLHRADPARLLDLVPAFWNAYGTALGSRATADLESRTVLLLAALMLARVHGKSPVEYLKPGDGDIVTAFAVRCLVTPTPVLKTFTADWLLTLASS